MFIRFQALCTLRVSAARNREIMKPAGKPIKLAKLSVDINIQSKQSIINCSESIQRQPFRLTSAFITFFAACLVILALILSTPSLLPSSWLAF